MGAFGIWSLWSRGRRDTVLIVISPFFIALIASAAQMYPLAPGRLTLYLAPAMIVSLAAGAGAIAERWPAGELFAQAGLLLVLVDVPQFVRAGTPPFGRDEDVRPVLSHVRAHYHKGDRIYVYWGAAPATEFYGQRYGIARGQWISGGLNGDDWKAYVPELDALRGSTRVWVVFAHTDTHEIRDGMIRYLDSVGQRRTDDAYPAPPPNVDATVILYDLSGSARTVAGG